MKNYLGNLIARHMSKADVLQPRLASRFEPQSNVLQSDGFEVETAEVDVQDTFGADSVSIDAISDPVLIAPVFPIAVPEIEPRVESPSVRSSRLVESVFESSGPPPALPAELTNPTIAANGNFEGPTASTTTSAVASDQIDESTVSRAHSAVRVSSADPVHSDQPTNSETRNVALTVFPTPPADTVAPSRIATTDQVAVADEVAEGAPRESTSTTQPVTARKAFTTREPVTARESVTPSRHEAPAKSHQTVTPPVELQRSFQETKTEAGRKAVASITETELPTTSVSNSEDYHSPDPAKPQQQTFRTEVYGSSRELLPTAVVSPELEAKPPVVIAVRESEVSPKQPERSAEEVQSPQVAQRARPLETSVARLSGNETRNTRMVSRDDIAPVETGPTINVTIGRIEVRAATSDVRPQTQRREQQVLSLDDYLSQRSAGGR